MLVNIQKKLINYLQSLNKSTIIINYEYLTLQVWNNYQRYWKMFVFLLQSMKKVRLIATKKLKKYLGIYKSKITIFMTDMYKILRVRTFFLIAIKLSSPGDNKRFLTLAAGMRISWRIMQMHGDFVKKKERKKKKKGFACGV